MADSVKLTYTAENDGNLTTSNIGSVNPNITNQQIKSFGEAFQDLVKGGNVVYATRTDTTKIVVSADSTDGE